jgi:hypothetical protein
MIAFGGARKGGDWVGADQVVLHFFQGQKESVEALLRYSLVLCLVPPAYLARSRGSRTPFQERA